MMLPSAAGFPYWRLSSFYFLYYAFLGAMMPYWSLYLQARGLDAAAIGVVLALMATTRIVAPNVWGWIADRSGRRLPVIRIGAFAALACFAGVLAPWGLGWLLLAVTLHTVFWNAILAQYEAITLATLGEEVQRYGQVRLWGSVSFILAVVCSGLLFDRVSVAGLPWLLLVLLALIAAGTLLIREPAVATRERAAGGLRALLADRAMLAFLAASFLLQFSHAPYYGFFSLYLADHGYSRAATGQMWSLGVIAEIGVFAASHRLLARFSLRNILLASLLLAALRWLMIGFGAGNVALLVVAQCLHAGSFGSFHAAGIEYLRRHFGPRQQGQGQALYAALSFGAGGAFGALVSGLLWDLGAPLGFLVAALAALLGWWIVRCAVRGPLVDVPGAAAPQALREGET
jgi:PPP family 3-phenylpropionic acid transporter